MLNIDSMVHKYKMCIYHIYDKNLFKSPSIPFIISPNRIDERHLLAVQVQAMGRYNYTTVSFLHVHAFHIQET